MTEDEPVLIVGAGIGGLTAALALSQRDVPCIVLERADGIRAVGAGITLQANAMVVMERLGLADALRRTGVELRSGRILGTGGRVIQEVDLAAMAEPGTSPGIALHRARLMEVLAEACPAPVELGAGVVEIEAGAGSVRVRLEDGRVRQGSLLIGCDGLHSTVRREMRGEDPLVYAGYTTWRGIARGMSAAPATVEIWGAGERFGLVPTGPDEVYWFAVADAPEGGEDGPNVLRELKRRFEGWPDGVAEALDRTAPDAVIRTDTHDRDPIEVWGDERVTLLGDAAHPMTPNLGQGAGQAVEDALALGLALDRHRDEPVAGLREYEDVRREKANGLVVRSRRLGAMAQLRNPLARRLRDLALKATPTAVMRRSVRGMYRPEVGPPRA